MTFAMGDTVAVEGRRDSIAKRTVAKVGKTSVTLDDGSRWTLSGHAWGESRDRWSPMTTIRLWCEDHDRQLAAHREKVERYRLRGDINVAISVEPDLTRMKRALAILTGKAE